MRLLKPTGRVDVMVEVALARPYDTYWKLWQWLNPDQCPHPHPKCLYWVQERGAEAIRETSTDHLIRGDN